MDKKARCFYGGVAWGLNGSVAPDVAGTLPTQFAGGCAGTGY